VSAEATFHGENGVAETILFERTVECREGDSIRFEREHGRTVRVLLVRKDGSVEEIPFVRGDGPPRPA
jgi:hypothetical protein